MVNIYVDGQWACDAERADRQVWATTQVWAADPWYAAADAVISEFYLADLTDSGEGGLPVGATLLGESAYGQLAANTQIENVNLPLDYEIGLDITPGPNINGAWTNIVHFTATNTCLLYTSPSPRDKRQSRMPSSA